MNEFRSDKFREVKPDSHLEDGPVEQCKLGCNITFRSKAGEERHNLFYHGKQQNTEKVHQCNFPGCNLAYPTRHYLVKHQTEKAHGRPNETRGRKAKNKAPALPDFVGGEAESEDDFQGWPTPPRPQVTQQTRRSARRVTKRSFMDILSYDTDEDEEV